ncbi:hypothetical protein EON66_09635 [archaeon]|nr:MAG: hypothetical protein EON66_09635 [archaeon]
MDDDPTTGFRKFNFLLQNPPFPPETFGNLLLLYIKYGCYDLAADIMAENAHLTYKYLTPELYDFLDATIMVQTSPEEVRGCTHCAAARRTTLHVTPPHRMRRLPSSGYAGVPQV